MSDPQIKVLFDTDIGSDIDDAVALAYLLSQDRCRLLGITTVSGEADRRAEMASAICRNVGRGDIPIHAGCDRPLLIPPRQPQARQAGALGDWDRQRSFAPNTAIEFLRRTIRQHEGEITLLATGPLTNLAVLFATDPELPAMLRGLVLMCGRFQSAMGGEWNAVCDPHAAAVVYGGGPHRRPPRHVSFGLDVTRQCRMSAVECRRRFTAKALAPVRDFAEVWFSQKVDHITFHDPLAAAGIFQEDLCRYQSGNVSVSLNEPTLGWTVLGTKGDDLPHAVAAEVDSQRFFEHYFDTVK